VSIVINTLIKYLLPVMAIALVGCAVKPVEPLDRNDMVGFKTDCGRAQQQVDYLQSRIDAYREYFKDRPPTLEDQRYMSKLKNNLWSLRSSCSALQR
jgi:hypothetical protein